MFIGSLIYECWICYPTLHESYHFWWNLMFEFKMKLCSWIEAWMLQHSDTKFVPPLSCLLLQWPLKLLMCMFNLAGNVDKSRTSTYDITHRLATYCYFCIIIKRHLFRMKVMQFITNINYKYFIISCCLAPANKRIWKINCLYEIVKKLIRISIKHLCRVSCGI